MTDIEEENTFRRKYNRKVRRKNDSIPPLFGVQQLIGLHLDIHSPKFLTACKNLGILPDECILKPFEEFDPGTKDPKLAESRYTHYMERLIHTLNKIILERHRIKEEQKKKPAISRSQSPVTSSRILVSGSVLSPETIKKGIKQEQTVFKEMLQREAQRRMQEEAERRQLSQQIKERLEKAQKREKTYKATLIEGKLSVGKRYDSVSRKAREQEMERVKMHEQLKRQQIDDIEQKAAKKQMLEQEKLIKYQQREEEYQKKIMEIKRQRSIASKEESEKRVKLLQSLEEQYSAKKTKGDKYLKQLIKELQAKNENKRRKMEAFRKSQQETEASIKKNYRSIQNTILQTILSRKDEDLLRFKKRVSPTNIRAESSKIRPNSRKGSEDKDFE